MSTQADPYFVLRVRQDSLLSEPDKSNWAEKKTEIAVTLVDAIRTLSDKVIPITFSDTMWLRTAPSSALFPHRPCCLVFIAKTGRGLELLAVNRGDRRMIVLLGVGTLDDPLHTPALTRKANSRSM
jgi:hypothetical protein